MTVLQVGVYKSGNLWLWNLIEGILARGSVEPRRYVKKQPVHALSLAWDREFSTITDVDFIAFRNGACFYLVGPSFQAPIDDLGDYVFSSTHAWSHSFHGKGAAGALARFDKIVYLVRDPRDCAVSYGHYHFTPFRRKHYPVPESSPAEYLERNLAPFMRAWSAHVGEFLLHRETLPVHFVFYERLWASFDEEAGHLARYLGVTLDGASLESLRRENAIGLMKASDPDHARRGGIGEWRAALTARQAAEARAAAGPMLKLLGYEGTAEPSLARVTAVTARRAAARAHRLTPRELARRIKERYLKRF